MRKTITALYLVKNEEEFLPLSVATVIDDVDEVIIIDNESTDNSKQIGKDLQLRFPEKVRFIEMDGDFDHNCEYVNRNKAIKYVTSEWVMVLDADQLISDGWCKWVRNAMADKRNDAIRFRYEHLVGSYEYIHKAFYEKQKNPKLDTEPPLWITCMYRMRPDLECKPAMLVDSRFKAQHHANFDQSMTGRKFYNCGSATCFHYGFAKKNMMDMSAYRIHRGDYGHDQETKDRLTKELRDSGNPFKFIGSVCRVDYGSEFVPNVIRNMFGKTYKLQLDKDGFIQSRTYLPTGEKL